MEAGRNGSLHAVELGVGDHTLEQRSGSLSAKQVSSSDDAMERNSG